MTCRRILTFCAVLLAVGLPAAVQPAGAQQQPGRAKLPPAQSTARQPRQPASSTEQQQPRVDRPVTELEIPAELEELLVKWERESGQIKRLYGKITRFVYDGVYHVEKQSIGEFWYQSPDQGRMDFKAVRLPDPPLSRDKEDPHGRPYTVQSGPNERWICTGKEIFLIHDDQRLYDLIQIPPQQQGRNIIDGPLPFLFGMKAEKAKARYHLALGKKHRPVERIATTEEGKRIRLPIQYHIVAYPKLRVDADEWSRAEVMLDAKFLPMGIKLLNPTRTKETVYVFPAPYLKVNPLLWPNLNNPFNDRPPSGFTKDNDTRATSDESISATQDVVPTGGERRRQ